MDSYIHQVTNRQDTCAAYNDGYFWLINITPIIMMKTNRLFCAILFACTASFIQCSDDERPTKEQQDCYPIQIPGEEGSILTLSYSDSHQVTDIILASADEPDTEFTSTLEYTDGKLSKINHYADGEMYQVIEYTAGQIIDHQFDKGEVDFFEDTRYI